MGTVHRPAGKETSMNLHNLDLNFDNDLLEFDLDQDIPGFDLTAAPDTAANPNAKTNP
jgi:hypothetical protein